VLKRKYYHNSDFMDARTKRGSSHTWRAILHGREALRKGLIKHVGDGSTIRAFDDPWIPANLNGRSLFKPLEAKITTSKKQEHMCWSKEKLEVNFIATDRDSIHRIPLRRFNEDEWLWTQERSGNFSVRSCCRLIESIQRACIASGSSNSEDPCWKKLWSLPVPPKGEVILVEIYKNNLSQLGQF
jgi:hypothetical protein